MLAGRRMTLGSFSLRELRALRKLLRKRQTRHHFSQSHVKLFMAEDFSSHERGFASMVLLMSVDGAVGTGGGVRWFRGHGLFLHLKDLHDQQLQKLKILNVVAYGCNSRILQEMEMKRETKDIYREVFKSHNSI